MLKWGWIGEAIQKQSQIYFEITAGTLNKG